MVNPFPLKNQAYTLFKLGIGMAGTHPVIFLWRRDLYTSFKIFYAFSSNNLIKTHWEIVYSTGLLHTEAADSLNSLSSIGASVLTLAPDFCLLPPHGAGRFIRERYKKGASVLYTRPRFLLAPSTRKRPMLSSDCWRGRVRTAPPQQNLKNKFSVGKI